MTDLNPYQTAVKALALGKPEGGELMRPLIKEDPSRFALYTTALFVGLVERRFQEDHSLDAIASFMKDMKFAFRNAEPPLKLLATEALIKAVWDEDQPIDEIGSKEQQLCELAVIRHVAHEDESARADLDNFLHDADLMVKAWLDQDSQ